MFTLVAFAVIVVLAFLVDLLRTSHRPPTMRGEMHRAMRKHDKAWRKTVERHIADENRDAEPPARSEYSARGRRSWAA